MIIKAGELTEYMKMHDVSRVPLEAITVDIPVGKNLAAKRQLTSKRIIVYSIRVIGYGANSPFVVKLNYTDVENKRQITAVPDSFEFELITGAEGQKALDDLVKYENGLEASFRSLVAEYEPTIQEKLRLASVLINEAKDIAETHSIPFRPDFDITGLSMSYFPRDFKQVFGSISRDLIEELTNAYGEGYHGWQSSQAC